MVSKMKAILSMLYLLGEIDKKITRYVERLKRKVRRYVFIVLFNAIISFLGILYFTQGLIIWLKKNTSIPEEGVYMSFGILLMLFAWIVSKILLWQEKAKAI